jgi:hypothetical protein
MEDTFSEFSAFVTKNINDEYEKIMSSTSKDYGKALKALREREVFELRLQQSNASLSAFLVYLDWERSSTKSSIPRLTQTLFERALVIHWQESSIWQDYIYFAVWPFPMALIGKYRSKRSSMIQRWYPSLSGRLAIVPGVEIFGHFIFDFSPRWTTIPSKI